MYYSKVVGSGGSISHDTEQTPFKSFKFVAKASLALVCTASIFMPSLSAAVSSQRVREFNFCNYATDIKVGDTTDMHYIATESKTTADSYVAQSGLDMLFPSARSSNEYEQKIVAELINDFFE